jgi:NADH:ubiquinone oxidoreductase subunit 4 (subunit M)
MFILIVIWGSRGRKVHAAFYFVIYTLISSCFLLYGLFLFYDTFGSFDWKYILNSSYGVGSSTQTYIVFFFLVGFAAKVPMVPLHLWLPEAHVEAPTVVSVILASLLLKLGVYGLARVSLMCPLGLVGNQNLVWGFALLSIFYSNLLAIRALDLKKILAYSSIVHMNVGLIALFTGTQWGLVGCFLGMISHTFTSASLFFLAGMLYERVKSRNLLYFSAEHWHSLRILKVFFLVNILINMGLPGGSAFIAELIQYSSVLFVDLGVALFVIIGGFLLSMFYNLLLLYKTVFSLDRTRTKFILEKHSNMMEEILILLILLLLNLSVGFFPHEFVQCIEVIEFYKFW